MDLRAAQSVAIHWGTWQVGIAQRKVLAPATSVPFSLPIPLPSPNLHRYLQPARAHASLVLIIFLLKRACLITSLSLSCRLELVASLFFPKLTAEPLLEPPRLLVSALAAQDLPPATFVALAHGETRTFPLA